ncbi:MAG: hypothetical protein K2I78_04495, partial [Clostridia bacterium]|nr:hypothetical protein [Clostridia bacterium]
MEENKFEDLQGGLLDSLDEMLGAKSENTDKPSTVEDKVVAPEIKSPVAEEKKSGEDNADTVEKKTYEKPFVHLHVHSEYSLLD